MKLSPWAIYLIGFFLTLPVLAFGYCTYWLPNMAEKDMYDTLLPQVQAEGAKLNAAVKRRDQAIKMVQASASDWRRVEQVRTPVTGVENGGAPNMSVTAYQLSVDTRKFRNNLQRAINNQLHAGGVRVISGPYVPEQDPDASNALLGAFYNYPPLEFPVVLLNLGQVQVEGKSYKQIFDHVKAWSNIPHYLAITDSLAMTGTTPTITATYNLTLVAFIRGSTIAPAVSEGAATGGGGSPFGGGAPFGGGGGPSLMGASAAGGRGGPPGKK